MARRSCESDSFLSWLRNLRADEEQESMETSGPVSLASSIKPVEEVLQEAGELFLEKFKKPPSHAGVAPGRVNLIGEHTDYNCGYVLPMALPMVTVVMGGENRTKTINIYTSCPSVGNSFFSMSTEGVPTLGKDKWTNYIRGVIAEFKNYTKQITGFDAVIVSTVPPGSGLSSSAALEIATFTFLEEFSKEGAVQPLAKAILCQRAEHKYAKVPCGLMDQLISALGRKDYAMLIDCKDYTWEHILLKDATVLVINSGVKHDLGQSEYPKRKAECEEAAAAMGNSSLRESTLEILENCRGKMSIDAFKRAKHVISENIRAAEGARALASQDFTTFGLLMTQSHNSLKNDFNVSCPEIDTLVEAALSCEGVYGSRITGGGFGGCTVTLVKPDLVEEVMTQIKEKVPKELGSKLTFYVVTPSDGAGISEVRYVDGKTEPEFVTKV